MSNIKKEVKSPKLIMSLVKKSQTKEMLITTTLIVMNLLSFLFLTAS